MLSPLIAHSTAQALPILILALFMRKRHGLLFDFFERARDYLWLILEQCPICVLGIASRTCYPPSPLII